jgi:hypothetical protein
MSSYYDSRTQSVLLYPKQLARSAFVPHRGGQILKVGHFPRRANAHQELQIDARLLRTGAANFSASGLKRQDNDLIVIESAGAAAAFKQTYEARFASGEALPVGPG